MGTRSRARLAVVLVAAFGAQDAAAEGFAADGIVYDQLGQPRIYVRPGNSIVYDEPGATRLYLSPGDSVASATPAVPPAVGSNGPTGNAPSIAPTAPPKLDGPKAADGTPMFLEDGSYNPDFTHPPHGYRSPEGFQAVQWGASPAEVRKAFPGARPGKSALLTIRGKTAGLKTTTGFYFAGEALAMAAVVVEEEHLTSGGDLQDHESLKRLLMRKYGKSAIDEEVWENDVFKGEERYRLTAIQLGALKLRTIWYTGETTIRLQAEGNGTGATVTVLYVGARLLRAFEEERDARRGSDL